MRMPAFLGHNSARISMPWMSNQACVAFKKITYLFDATLVRSLTRARSYEWFGRLLTPSDLGSHSATCVLIVDAEG